MLFGFTLVSLVAGFATASPFLPVTNGRKVHSRDIVPTETTLANLKMFAQWAGAAYCNDEGATGDRVLCDNDVCPKIEAHVATVIGSFSANTLTAMKGFVGLDPLREEIVVSLKGSNSVRNWLANLDFKLDSCDTLAPGCKVHEGWHNAWKDIQTAAFEYTLTAMKANPRYRVVVTGHSLGAAVANIGAAYFRQSGIAADLYSYGSPRVGNQEFVDVLAASQNRNQTAGRNYRVTHTDDPFTRLPPATWMLGSYRHVSPEYWITQEAGNADAGLSDLKVCEGSNNDDCNSGTSGIVNMAHMFYYGGIAGCGSVRPDW